MYVHVVTRVLRAEVIGGLFSRFGLCPVKQRALESAEE